MFYSELQFLFEFLKLSNFYDVVHSLAEDHGITKTKIAGSSSKCLPQNVVSPHWERSNFWDICFPLAERGGGRTLWKHFHNFLSITCFSAN